ncbi:MAG: alpha-hydroxy acid oxidase [Pseudomonadota bacterium]
MPDYPSFLCMADMAEAAGRHWGDALTAHVEEGGGADQTRQANEAAFDRLRIWPRVLADVRQGHTALTLLDEAFAHPILLGPLAYQTALHPEGELATAEAATAMDAGMVLSTLSSCSLEAVAAQLPSRKWFQLYFQASPDDTLRLLRRAEAAGYSALVVTVDVPVHGARLRSQKAGFVMPKQVRAVNLEGLSAAQTHYLQAQDSVIFQGHMAAAPRWESIAWLQQQTTLPIILKGILHPQDALQAKRLGLAGVVVSNHGGRALEGSPASLAVLPQVRAAVGDDFMLLLDGGIRRGSDVFKALALGAQAVLLGRPQAYGLGAAGALGVAQMLRLLREELELTMALAGCATLADISSACLVNPNEFSSC